MAKAAKTVKAKKVKELTQTHGAVSSYINFYDNIYTTNDYETYSGYVRNLDNSELHDHSVHVGEVPIEDRYRLIDRLERRFLSHQARNIPTQEVGVVMNAESQKNIKKFMAQAL